MSSKPPHDSGLDATLVAPDRETAPTIASPIGADTDVASPRARDAEGADTLVAHVGVPSAPISPRADGTLAASGPRPDADFAERYTGGELLGRGGMGEVRQYLDSVVGRNVAIKFLIGSAGRSDEAGARFIREARVQGQLQHPAVVPVYDLGVTSDGSTFFSMKRLGGRTLKEILDELRRGATDSLKGQRQLLTAFSDVCLAVDYAHTRGVVHRDLKPANIMLGDFGEVYVLDWGLARLADDEAPPSRTAESEATTTERLPRESRPIDSGPIAEAAGLTSVRSVMGTVGYMPPEQLQGKPLGIAADVYALGAILFEILALEPLHNGSNTAVIAASTLHGCSDRIKSRAAAHAIAPELEALCVSATAIEVADRLPSARALYDRLEGYMAGDRDLARRQEIAAELAGQAEAALADALSAGDLEARKRSMRLSSRALALDPEQADAPRVLMQLLLEPPTETPAEVEALLEEKRRADDLRHARLAAAGYGSWLIAFPMFVWMGVLDWMLSGAMVASVLTCAAASWVAARSERVSTGLLIVGVFMNAATLFLLTRLFGPLLLVPTLAVSTSLAFTLYGKRVTTILGPLTAVAAIIAAVVLEAAGVIARSYTYVDGELRVTSQVLELRPVATTVTLTALISAAVIVAAWFVANVRASLDRAEAANMTMVWQYRQLAPDGDE